MLKDTIKADMIAAMKAKDQDRLTTIRMLQAAIQRRELDDQTTLDDAGVIAVVEKAIKQRRDAATQFTDANRPELADKEIFEISVIDKYLPAQLSDAEITDAIKSAITDTSASSMQDMGPVMGVLKSKLQGRADMSVVSKLVREQLA